MRVLGVEKLKPGNIAYIAPKRCVSLTTMYLTHWQKILVDLTNLSFYQSDLLNLSCRSVYHPQHQL